ncbi:MAG: alpha,alpha-trehalose-phosphate synthase (UDP-forming) [Leptospirillum sp.]
MSKKTGKKVPRGEPPQVSPPQFRANKDKLLYAPTEPNKKDEVEKSMNINGQPFLKSQHDCLLVVTNREPIVLTGSQVKYPAGGVSQSLHRLLLKEGGIWIATRDSEGPDQVHIQSSEGAGYDLSRVSIPPHLKSDFYEGFSNDVLWPAFHGCPEFMAPAPSFYSSYDQVNHMFAQNIAKVLEKSTPSVVWIHDYQLTRVALWLRKDQTPKLPPLAFFCHIPWPSKEHLIHILEHKEIVEGLLAHDLIGFQTEQDRENFLQSVTAFIRNAEVLTDGMIRWNNRLIKVMSMPIGVDSVMFERMANNTRNLSRAHSLLTANKLGNNARFLISVDRMDYTKGFIQRFEILRQLFTTNPKLQGKISLLQIAVPTRTGQKIYRNHQEKIRQGVHAINHEFGTKDWLPIISIEETFEQETLSGLYKLAEGALITSTIDGMNLVSQEFLASQNGGYGILFLSRYTGTATILKNAVSIDPLDPTQSAERISAELAMPREARRLRNLSLMEQVRQNDLAHWVSSLRKNIASFSNSNTKKIMVA